MGAEKLAAARLRAVKSTPYFGAALWGLINVPVEGLGTCMADDKYRFYYDPDMLDKWSVQELAGAMVHEVCHLLRRHAETQASLHAEPELWNDAADLAVNPDIAEIQGITLQEVRSPGGRATKGLMPETYGLQRGLAAPEYYAHLREKQQRQPQKGGGQKPPTNSRPDPNGNKDGQQEGQGQQQQQQKGGGQGQPHEHSHDHGKLPGSGGCCGSASGHRHPKEQEAQQQAEAQGAAGRSQVDQKQIARRTAEQIKEYGSKTRGTVPAGWERWADEMMEPAKVDWRRELQSAVRSMIGAQSGMADYTYTRPSRRSASTPLIMPSLRRPVPDVAVGIDTSGSMSNELLGEALRETDGVLKQVGSSVRVLVGDAAVHETKRVFSVKDIQLLGGGGTSMAAVVRAAAEMSPTPSTVIIITDGYTDWPDPEECKRFKLIWAIVGDYANDAPVGVTIHVQD